jgi:glycosyltransferase involved in cell wall biosynthesis
MTEFLMQKNVLFIHHVSCLAGAERYLLSLIEALDPCYKVFFICQESGPLSEALIRHGVTVEYMPLGAWRKFRCIESNLRTIQSIVHFCKKYHIDLICSNNYRVTSYVAWPARLLGIPSMTIIQDFVNRSKLAKFNTFESDVLISVSESISAAVGKFSKKKATIYNGLDIPSWTKTLKTNDVLREEFPSLRGKRIVGMIAHIIPLKGHKDFLKAMQRIAKRFEDVHFVIIGDSPHPEQLSLADIQAYANELNLGERVVFTGARNDVGDLLKSFDLLVHPSYKEAFGRVIMEAMALGVPVVATDCGGPREIIEEGISGFLVPVGDTAALAIKVGMLLSDDTQRKTIGQQGRRRIEQRFNIPQTVAKANDVLEEVLGKGA